MGHSDRGKAADTKFMLNEISAIEHVSKANRVEDIRRLLDIVLIDRNLSYHRRWCPGASVLVLVSLW